MASLLRLIAVTELVLCGLAAVKAECKGSHCMTVAYSPASKDHRLEGHVIEQSTVSFKDCMMNCTLNCACLSINYKESEQLCQLNSEQVEAGALTSVPGVDYFPLRLTPQTTQNQCQECSNFCCVGDQRCFNGGRCLEVCDHSSRRFNCSCAPGTYGNTCKIKARNCEDVKRLSKQDSDDDYVIFPEAYPDSPVKVYCQKMSTGSPITFLSFEPGTQNYVHRLKEKNKVSLKDTCDFEQDGDMVYAGKTIFTKVKIIMSADSIKIDRSNREFATAVFGNPLWFGQSTDCKGTQLQCNKPRGSFQIDLTGTGLKVLDPLQVWKPDPAPISAMNITSFNEDILVHGECGGYCGGCIPKASFIPLVPVG